MIYEIFKFIPHQRIVSNESSIPEIFDLYQCGKFKAGSMLENIEIVELQAKANYRRHYHKNSTAIIYIILGTGLFKLANDLIEYTPETRITIPAGIAHGFVTNTPTLFLSIQTPPIINFENGEIDLHYDNETNKI